MNHVPTIVNNVCATFLFLLEKSQIERNIKIKFYLFVVGFVSILETCDVLIVQITSPPLSFLTNPNYKANNKITKSTSTNGDKQI